MKKGDVGSSERTRVRVAFDLSERMQELLPEMIGIADKYLSLYVDAEANISNLHRNPEMQRRIHDASQRIRNIGARALRLTSPVTIQQNDSGSRLLFKVDDRDQSRLDKIAAEAYALSTPRHDIALLYAADSNVYAELGQSMSAGDRSVAIRRFVLESRNPETSHALAVHSARLVERIILQKDL